MIANRYEIKLNSKNARLSSHEKVIQLLEMLIWIGVFINTGIWSKMHLLGLNIFGVLPLVSISSKEISSVLSR